MTPDQSPARFSATVVIATRDRPQLARAAAVAAKAALRPGDSLILVDSASADPRDLFAIAGDTGATLIRCDEPGASKARNAGWRASTTDLVAFTDDDCLPDPQWLEAVVKTFEAEPTIGFVTGRVRPEATYTPRAWIHLSVTSRSEPVTFARGDDPTEIGHGANMTWRRSALELIGGFDEQLGPGTRLEAAEDVDAFWRLLMGGGSGAFSPDAVVAHRQWRGRARQMRVYRGYGVGAGALAVKRWSWHGREGRPPSRRAIARVAAHEVLWRHGIKGVARNVANGYAMGALSELAMLAGATEGVVKARRMRLVDGHFVSRS